MAGRPRWIRAVQVGPPPRRFLPVPLPGDPAPAGPRRGRLDPPLEDLIRLWSLSRLGVAMTEPAGRASG
eukprot:12561030-Alexandrium_andersonii.AAC.1